MNSSLEHTSSRPLYGCMGLGGAGNEPGYGAVEIAQAESVIEASLSVGITAFDHADIYNRGKAEAVFGEVLSRAPDLRNRIQIQTKCGIRLPNAGTLGFYDLRPGSIAARVAESLERLHTDWIDVLLLHRPDPLTHPADIAQALTSLHEQGLVRQFGVSNMSAPQIDHLQRYLELPLMANQLEMSLHSRDWVEAGVLVNTSSAASNGFPLGTVEYCMANGLQLQAWGSLAQGRYSGRPGGDDVDAATGQLVGTIAAAHHTTPEAVVLWWLQQHPAGIAPVIGSTNPGRILACADAVNRPPALTHEEWYELWTTARAANLP